MAVPYWLIPHTTTPMTKTSYPAVTSLRYHWKPLVMPFTPNVITKWSIRNLKSCQVLIKISFKGDVKRLALIFFIQLNQSQQKM